MSVTAKWDNEEKTAVRTTYSGDLSMPEVLEGMDLARELLDEVSHKVDIMADFLESKLPATMLASLPKVARHPGLNHPNMGRQVLIVNSIMMRQVADIFVRVFGQSLNYHVANTLEDAYTFLNQDS